MSATRTARATGWGVSMVATVVSTYALDLVATAAGLLAVAAGLTAGLGAGWLIAALVGSYVVWGLGLRVNLAANTRLLETTGTSTNVLSRAAFELLRRRGPRLRRLAASSGYVLTELAKELPYYAGALGAAAVAEPFATADAVTFLIGANLGAAAYEYALGKGTDAVVTHRLGSFDTDWVPAHYLRDYYRRVEPDEIQTIRFLVRWIAAAAPGRPMLYFGTGPTLHHVFLAAPVASELHLGDYLDSNLAEIRRWLRRDPTAHDWRPFVRHTLACELATDPDDAQVLRREELTRAVVRRLLHVDGRRPSSEPRYATVISAYCADSATRDVHEWKEFMVNVLDRVQPAGLLLLAMLRRAQGYRVGDTTFASADVDEDDLRRLVLDAWGEVDGEIQVPVLRGQPDHGYDGIVLAALRRPDRGCRHG